MSRFPFGIPDSWYLLAYSEDVPTGGVREFRYLGRELVAFRGESGTVTVADAFCPHLGAHLGVGGTVVGDSIQCPFHHWRFDGSGRCVDVPYARRVPLGARLATYPSRELAGMIFLWYGDREPFFELPAVPEWGSDDFLSSWIRYEWTVRTHPQEMVENGIDWPHFRTVHRMNDDLERDFRFGEHDYFWSVGARKQVTTMDDAVHDIYMEGENWGLGYATVRQWAMFTTVVATGMTPIDDETTQIRMGVLGKRDGKSPQAALEALSAYADEHAVLAQEDFPIWEHKKYRAQPLLCDADGPIPELRKWADHFYAESERPGSRT